ncbi:MAG: phenylalanine--tRNA ligase subunit beta, partial [Acidobacteriales bacterium]|nr:phenylalanine--tRNA ligase subunit beta [Terriglobales bacterium]
MRILPSWLRAMLAEPLSQNDQQLADDLTLIGIAVEGLDQTGSEAVFETEITTNRVDAMNHLGIARECSALYDIDLRPSEPKLVAEGTEHFPIEMLEPSLCARFSAVVLRDVEVGPSDGEVAARFSTLGQKLINLAADATNYVMLEMGKPTHVYDLDKLAGGKLVVRRARLGERLKTLDGVDRSLTSEDLVIADAEKPVGIGGVIGGEDTKVTESTRNILIESAWFDTATVRATSKRHGIHTDASHRFERGADYASTAPACLRVAELILKQGGGRTASPLLDNIAREIILPSVELRLSQVRRLLGKEISETEISRILARLGFTLRALDSGHFEVTVPTWRLDVSREIDLIEEIARVHGFNKFPNTLPAFLGGVTEVPSATREAKIRSKLLALGYNEALSSSFMSSEAAASFTPELKPVLLENPLNNERAVMRTTLIPGMLEMVEHNLNRGQDRVRLFEIGNAFHANGDHVVQRPLLCLASTRPDASTDWPQGDFFQQKGDLESLWDDLGNPPRLSEIAAAEIFHSGRSAMFQFDGSRLASFGEIKSGSLGQRKLKQPVYLAQIELGELLAQPSSTPKYQPISRFPSIERDFSFLLPDSVTWHGLQSAIEQLAIPDLQALRIVEVFRGKSVGAGRYSA